LVSRTLRDSDVCMKLRNNENANTLHAILQQGPTFVAA
jgi:PTS system nitrogen regulatory IIA component